MVERPSSRPNTQHSALSPTCAPHNLAPNAPATYCISARGDKAIEIVLGLLKTKGGPLKVSTGSGQIRRHGGDV